MNSCPNSDLNNAAVYGKPGSYSRTAQGELPPCFRLWSLSDKLEYSLQLSKAKEPQLVADAYGLKYIPYPGPHYSERRQVAAKCSQSISDTYPKIQNILDKFEHVVRKRWAKKRTNERKRILLEAWPDMPTHHRPDFHAYRSEPDAVRVAGETQFRDAYLWPYINMEDLSSGNTFLRLLNSQGRSEPAAFAVADLESTRLGRLSKALPFEFNFGFLDMVSPVSHGKYGKFKPKHQDDVSEASARFHVTSGKELPASDSILVLEIQSRLFEFLLSACENILHDKKTLFDDSSIPSQPEPDPLSEHDGEWDSALRLALERPYKAPKKANLKELLSLAQAKLDESRDHAWSLREDPGYFDRVVREYCDHGAEKLQGLTPTGTKPARRDPNKGRDEAVGVMVLHACASYKGWEVVVGLLEEAIPLDEAFVKSGMPFEEDCPEYFLIQSKLRIFLKGRFQPILLGNLALYFMSSPIMRRHWQRVVSTTKTSSIKDIQIFSKENGSSWLFGQLYVWEDFSGDAGEQAKDATLCAAEDIITEIEIFMNSTPSRKAQMTSLVAGYLAEAGLVGELQNQLKSYRPRIWSTWQGPFGPPLLKKNIAHDLGMSLKPWEDPIACFYKELSWLMNDHLPNGELGRLGDPTDGRFAYPSHQKRTRDTTLVLQEAERNLDRFWEHFDADIKTCAPELSHWVQDRFQPRQINRTPDWVNVPVAETVPSPAGAPLSALDSQFGNIFLDEHIKGSVRNSSPISASAGKEKVKTRPTDTPSVAQQSDRPVTACDRNDDEGEMRKDSRPTFLLSHRALQVVRCIFYHPSQQHQPGEILWKDFLHAMVAMGFLPKKLYGSIWSFEPVGEQLRALSDRRINVHEPHPAGKMPFQDARRLGRRLTRAYGLDSSSFGKK